MEMNGGKLGKLSECWKFLIDAPFDISEYCCIVMKEKSLIEYVKRTGRSEKIYGKEKFDKRNREVV